MKQTQFTNKKHLYIYIGVLFITSIFSFSCKNLFQNNETGSVTIYLPEIQNNTQRTAINTSAITKYEFKLTSKDGKNTFTSLNEASSKVEFNDIPVGSYTLSGKAFNKDGVLFAENSEDITISAGKNDISFTLNTNIAYGVYSKDKNKSIRSINIYSTQNTTTPIKIDFDTSVQVFNYAFDTNQNLYYILFKENSSTLKVRYVKEQYKNESEILTGNFSVGTTTQIFVSEDNILYLISFDDSNGSGTNYSLFIYDILNNHTATLSGFTSFTSTIKPLFALTKFINNISTLCYVEYDSSGDVPNLKVNTHYIERKKNGNKIEYEIKNNVVTDSTANFESVLLFIKGHDKFPSSSKITLYPTDITIKNDEYYVTLNSKQNNTNYNFPVSSLSISDQNFNSTIYQVFGAVVKFKLDNEYKINLNTIKTYGYSTQIQSNEYNYTKNDQPQKKYLNFQTPSTQTENKEFYGPVKILALKGKKAWILDDGVSFVNDEILRDENNNQIPKYLTKRRLIIMDLETGTFDSITNLTTETLENITLSNSYFSGF